MTFYPDKIVINLTAEKAMSTGFMIMALFFDQIQIKMIQLLLLFEMTKLLQ